MIDRLARQLRKEERDFRVLEAVLEHHPIGISRLASETGVDEHEARYLSQRESPAVHGGRESRKL
ncbi:hypothetical protein BRC84_02770 [Halobacteriales archaeon QS_1_68_44]|nr:MAG: hypothetical protein BRC84_02770 [Halobacteriales archaeon QS_1_68_44]